MWRWPAAGPALGEKEPGDRSWGINVLVLGPGGGGGGSLLGEILGINQLLGDLWFWFGHQGWEYLDLGRGWQVLLAWDCVVGRSACSGLAPALQEPGAPGDLVRCSCSAALAIPLFYLPAFFFGSTTKYTVVDNWRFWIIHLWVEGFFELLVTVMVAVTFYRLGVVSRQTAARVIYLDAILFLGAALSAPAITGIGPASPTSTGPLRHVLGHGGGSPDASDAGCLGFYQADQGRVRRLREADPIPHKWTFYFLMAVGFWNFVGAGIFGFLINLPIISYFEVGTILTPNHGHAPSWGPSAWRPWP